VNLKDITAGPDARLNRIDQTLATVNRAVDQFGRASTNIASAVDRMSLDVSPLVKQTEGTMREVGDAVKAVESQTVLLAQQLRTVSETASLDLHSTARELRITAEALDRVESPSWIRGRSFRPSPARSREKVGRAYFVLFAALVLAGCLGGGGAAAHALRTARFGTGEIVEPTAPPRYALSRPAVADPFTFRESRLQS
jgi:hypothetical protein